MKDLSPNGWFSLAEKLRDNEQFAIEYKWNNERRGPGSLQESCDANCRKSTFCEASTSEGF